MAKMVWNARMMLGIGEVDAQHKVLIDLINKLDEAIRQGKGNQVAATVMGDLKLYTLKHFRAEERMFAVHGYSDADAHKRLHAEFVAKVEKFEADIRAGKLGVATTAMNFLSDWLGSHILVEDRKYVASLLAAGVS